MALSRPALRPAATVLAMAALLALATPAPADEVTLANGDHVTGTIMRITPATVEVRAYGAVLEIPRASLKSLRSDQPVAIVSAGGATHTAFVAPSTQPAGFAEAPAAVAAAPATTAPAPATSAPAPAAPPVQTPAALDLEPYYLPFGPHWKNTLALGAISTAGNTDSTSANGELDLQYNAKPWELTIKFGALYGTTNGRQSDALAYNDDILRRTLPEWHTDRLYFFGEDHNTYDGIKGISWRSVTAAGFGYYLAQGDKLSIDVRGGPGYHYERYFSGRENSDFVGLAGLRATYAFNARVKLSQEVQYTTAVNRFEDYQIAAESALTIKLPDIRRGLGLRFAFRDDYDNTTAKQKRNDTRLTAALTLDF
jgi:putative salt-induced outer membrane protein YdiY